MGKECLNKCPQCNRDDIDWGSREWQGDVASILGVCCDCGCEFEEYYTYSETEIIS